MQTSAGGQVRPTPSALVAGAPLSYVSDYVSFAGADVLFALDTNRGYDADPPRGEPFQAEHAYAVLHARGLGWVPLEGVRRYPLTSGDPVPLPDSAWFAFAGSPDEGLAVTSPVNDLRLDVEPLLDRLVRTDPDTMYVMRTAAARLTWRGRQVPGRVTYEQLVTRRGNLLSRRSFSGLGGLEFLYLAVGEDGSAGDLYLQKILGGSGPVAGMEPQLGFFAPASAGPAARTALTGLDIETVGHRPAPGLYRWPTRWRVRWTGAGTDAVEPSGRLDLQTGDRTTVGRYGVAGFAMAAAHGTLTRPDGSTLPVRGLAELLAGGPLLQLLAARPG